MDKDELDNILTNHSKGLSNGINQLINKLLEPDCEVTFLKNTFTCLRQCVLSVLATDDLISTLQKGVWLRGNEEVSSAYQHFLVSLVSAGPHLVVPFVRTLLGFFLPANYAPGDRSSEIPSEEVQQQDLLFASRARATLSSVIELVPMSKVCIPGILAELWPHHLTQGTYRLCFFFVSTLRLCVSEPSLSHKILYHLIDRFVEIDLLASRADIQLSEVCDFEFDFSNVDSTCLRRFRANSDAVEKVLIKEGEFLVKHDMGNKLDCLMDVVLTYIHDTCHPADDNVLDWISTRKLYKSLLFAFDKLVLTTHDPSYVQFFLFYITSFHESLVDGFVDYLWKKMQSPSVPSVFRVAAASYLSGFLARGKHVNILTVQSTLQLVSDWTRSYIREVPMFSCDTPWSVDSEHSVFELERHAPFYATCQSLFYVFSFRHKEILSGKNGWRLCESLGFQGLITCRLNPLNFCVHSVVHTFASIARRHQIAFCDTVIERNSRQRLPFSHKDGFGSPLTLDSLFPFEPYPFPRSFRFIGYLYADFDDLPVELLTHPDLLSDESEEDEDWSKDILREEDKLNDLRHVSSQEFHTTTQLCDNHLLSDSVCRPARKRTRTISRSTEESILRGCLPESYGFGNTCHNVTNKFFRSSVLEP